MASAYVRGVALAPFGHTPSRSFEELVQPPIVSAVRASGLDHSEIEAVVVGSYASGVLVGQRAIRGLGLSGRLVVNIENACASSAFAAHHAVSLVTSEECRNVLVIGVEQLSRYDSSLVPLNDDDPDVQLGLIMPGLYAMRARRYMYEFGASIEDLASVSVKNHANGALNPNARYQKVVSLRDVLESRAIADPLTLLQCCSGGDGAGAAVISSTPGETRSVRIAASIVSAGLDTSTCHDMARSELTASLAKRAYDVAGIGPMDLDIIELHDAFTIGELIYTEALGLCPCGSASSLLRSGKTSLDGKFAVNPSGGLLARGHPVGATGIAQIAEVVWQLRGEAGPRQRGSRRIGLTHTTGGGISGYDHAACAIHVLQCE